MKGIMKEDIKESSIKRGGKHGGSERSEIEDKEDIRQDGEEIDGRESGTGWMPMTEGLGGGGERQWVCVST
eukprot:764824-Hanusia_phi.AAC.2